LYASASSEYLVPLHASHGIVTGSANATSGFVTPFPLQNGHAPKELKLNKPAGCPVLPENIARISSMIPIYVASVERLEIPILPCPTIIVSGYFSGNASNISELLPEPDTPHIETKTFLGIVTFIFFKLLLLAFFIVKYSFISLGCLFMFSWWFRVVAALESFSPDNFP